MYSSHIGISNFKLILIQFIRDNGRLSPFDSEWGVSVISFLLTLLFSLPFPINKHRFLASNNFIALLGMFILYNFQIYLPEHVYTQYTRIFCAFRVVWRFFGFNSGCIAVVMATERWLALTKPFTYRKFVTETVILKVLIGFCVFAAVLSCLPLFGFGLYFDADKNVCQRYREATEPIDVGYAFTFFSFGNKTNDICNSIGFSLQSFHSIPGTLIVIWIVACNLSVTNELYRVKTNRCSINPLIARSKEEIRFAKLMNILSLSFIICWLPQMACILIAQFWGHEERLHRNFCRIADLLMVSHFIIDPYIYVLIRCRQDRSRDCNKTISHSNTVQELYLDNGNNNALL